MEPSPKESDSSTPTLLQSSSYFSSNSATKYGGLVEISLSKQLKNQIMILLAFVDQEAPIPSILCGLVSLLRLFQLFGATLGTSFPSLVYGTNVGKFMQLISICFHLLPTFARHDLYGLVMLIGSLLFILFFILVCSSSFFFKQNGRISHFLSSTISMYQATFGYLLPPIMMQMTFEYISLLVSGKIQFSNVNLFLSCLSIVTVLIYLWYYSTIGGVSLVFKRDSLMTVDSQPQVLVQIGTLLLTSISALASNLDHDKILQVIFNQFSMIGLFFSLYSIYCGGAFISAKTEILVVSSSLFGLIMVTANSCFLFVEKKIDEPILVGSCAAWVICFTSSVFYVNHRRHSILLILDEIQTECDSKILANIIKRPQIMSNYAVTGFSCCHPVCISWELFQKSLECWPKSPICYTTFMKYVAIYPEAKTLLDSLRDKAISHRVHGAQIKRTLQQLQSISRQRERELSPSLKKSIEKISKTMIIAKSRLRQVWDLALAANISELEDALSKSNESITKLEHSLDDLSRQYPNNRFMVRTYCRFLHEIIGDAQRYQEMNNMAQQLKRGGQIAPDNTHELGLAAFPLLPFSMLDIHHQKLLIKAAQTNSDFEEDEISSGSIDTEFTTNLKNQIRSLKIPSVLFINISFLTAFCLVFLLVLIILFIQAQRLTIELLEPCFYIESLAQMRLYMPMSFVFMQRRILEAIDLVPGKPFFPSLVIPEAPLYLVNGSTDPQVHMSFAIPNMLKSMQGSVRFQSYKVGDPYMDEIRLILFSSLSMVFDYYKSPGVFESQNMSVLDVVAALSKDLSFFADQTSWDVEILRRNTYLNPFHNFERVANRIGNGLEVYRRYLSASVDKNYKEMLKIQICFSLATPILYLVILYYSMKKLKENKTALYFALTTIPKNVISSVSDKLRILKSSSETSMSTSQQNSEISKQEENLLRIFAGASDSIGNRNGLNAIALAIVMFIITMSLLLTNEFVLFFKKEWFSLICNAPHYDNVLSCPAMIYCAFVWIHSILMNINGINIVHTEKDIYFKKLKYYLDRSNFYYQLMRYGGADDNQFPFPGINVGLESSKKYLICSDYTEPVKTINGIFTCLTADNQYLLLDVLSRRMMYPLSFNSSLTFDPHSPQFNELYGLACLVIFDSFFGPMVNTVTPTVKYTMVHEREQIYFPVAAITIAAFLATVLLLFIAHQQGEHIRFALQFLYQVPPSALLQSSKIRQILSGQFQRTNNFDSEKNQQYYSQIIMKLPEAILITGKQQIVVECNKESTRYLRLERETIIGKSITNVFSLSHVEGKCGFMAGTYNLQLTPEAEPVQHFTLSISHQNVYILKDTTPTVKHQALLSEERHKTDKLLASILPSNLIDRVQAGETGISFSVQSASIVFIDIVDFTPWCGSNSADFVMKTLNTLFRCFDQAIAKQQTMIRIKCIGDCYMAAGGIFSEINNQRQHSREAVEFGLEAIQIVKEMDQTLGFQRQIRVGVNTGGPIVAGVLGTSKPTFEILGKPINLAQQMEHHGVPMKVHISRTVYENIYGTGYVVHEKGVTEVKGGPVLTYLVTGHIMTSKK